MCKYIFKSLAICSAILTLSSCADNWQAPDLSGSQQGTLNLEALSIDVSEVEKVINVEAGGMSRADNAYNLGDFIVKITNTDLDSVMRRYDFANTPEIVTLIPGNYKIEVYSHEVQPAEWNRPYFHVDQDFTIEKDKIQRLGTLKATLKNAAVSIRIDDELKKYIDDDLKVVVKANDEGTLTFLNEHIENGHKGYFKIVENSSTMVVTFSATVNGYPENVTVTAPDLEAGQHRIFTFRAKVNNNPVPDETGTVNPGGVEIDASVTDEDIDGNITLDEDASVVRPEDRPGYEQPDEPEQPGEDPEQPDTPDEPGEDVAQFTPSAGIDIDGINNYNTYNSENPASVLISCPAGVKNLFVQIVSDYLTDEFLQSVGLTTSFDLVNPGNCESGLIDLGLPVKDDVYNKTSVNFDITTLVPLLAASGDESMVHDFKITVTDMSGKSSRTITLTFSGNN